MDDRYRLDDFELYRAARAIRNRVYDVVRCLPDDERFALSQQMRRAAVSITNNIAEGHGRWQYQDNTRFCRIARGSTEEVIDDLNVCLDQQYGDQAIIKGLKADTYALIHQINSYIAYLQKSKQGESGTRPR